MQMSRRPRKSTSFTRAVVIAPGRPFAGQFGKSQVFPTEYNTKLINSIVVQIDMASASQTLGIDMTLNSAEDAYTLPVSAQQPLYYDQLRLLYERSIVLAAKVTVQVYEVEGTATKKMVTVLARGDETGVPTDSQATASTTSTFGVIKPRQAGTDGGTYTVSRYVSIGKFFGQDLNDASSSKYEPATLISTGASAVRWRMYFANLDGSTMGTEAAFVRIQLEQWVKFTIRRKVSDA